MEEITEDMLAETKDIRQQVIDVLADMDFEERIGMHACNLIEVVGEEKAKDIELNTLKILEALFTNRSKTNVEDFLYALSLYALSKETLINLSEDLESMILARLDIKE